ncbi:MAG: hypothetical protein HFF26_09530 [Oscillospiraceae bacterium]|nr:hypothetical protein [Oscillospiraceae bacterium]
MSKEFHKADAFISLMLLTAVIIVQASIFFNHSLDWYRGLYQILRIANIAVFLCAAYYAFMGLWKKRAVNACMVLQCLGVLLSTLLCQAILDGMESPGTAVFPMRYSIVAPYIVGIILAAGLAAMLEKVRGRS